MKIHPIRPIHRNVVVSFSLLVLGVSGLAVAWAWRSQSPTFVSPQSVPGTVERETHPTVPAPPTVTHPNATAPTTPSDRPQSVLAKPVEVYWLDSREGQIHLVPIPMARDAYPSDSEALTKALNYLLTHPKQVGLTSTIPTGTRLLDLRVTPSGIRVNLSREFQQGGGSASMIHRVAQVLYTVTSLDPNAKVYLSVEGKLLDEENPLGGEGIILKEPLTREEFAKDFTLTAQN